MGQKIDMFLFFLSHFIGIGVFSCLYRASTKKTLSNYFDGKVTEGVHSNTFLDESTFSTWGKKAIASYRHFQVNGYANAWVVLPEDVGGRDSYSLVVEMTDQRIFYAGLVVSLQVFIFCMLWGAFLFYRKRLFWYNKYNFMISPFTLLQGNKKTLFFLISL